MTVPTFIQVFPNVLSNEECDALIQDFELLNSLGAVQSTALPKHKLRDTRINLTTQVLMSVANRGFVIPSIHDHIVKYLSKYEEGLYSPSSVLELYSEGLLMQKTEPSEGYHVWHCERQKIVDAERVLSWILYLNDVEDGGETEFLYYSKRIRPVKGSLLVFPAGFTHAHRGNPPLKGSKYVVTGWHRYIA